MSEATLKDVFLYWRDAMREDPDAVATICEDFVMDPGEPCCFACGWRTPDFGQKTAEENWAAATSYLDRGHLINRYIGGRFEVENLVPLCHKCNRNEMKNSTFFDRASALAWVRDHPGRSSLFQMFSDEACATWAEGYLRRAGITPERQTTGETQEALIGMGTLVPKIRGAYDELDVIMEAPIYQEKVSQND